MSGPGSPMSSWDAAFEVGGLLNRLHFDFLRFAMSGRSDTLQELRAHAGVIATLCTIIDPMISISELESRIRPRLEFDYLFNEEWFADEWWGALDATDLAGISVGAEEAFWLRSHNFSNPSDGIREIFLNYPSLARWISVVNLGKCFGELEHPPPSGVDLLELPPIEPATPTRDVFEEASTAPPRVRGRSYKLPKPPQRWRPRDPSLFLRGVDPNWYRRFQVLATAMQFHSLPELPNDDTIDACQEFARLLRSTITRQQLGTQTDGPMPTQEWSIGDGHVSVNGKTARIGQQICRFLSMLRGHPRQRGYLASHFFDTLDNDERLTRLRNLLNRTNETLRERLGIVGDAIVPVVGGSERGEDSMLRLKPLEELTFSRHGD